MRITFLLPCFGWRPSGGFHVVYRYAGELARRGHEVTVVHPRRLPPGGWPAAQGARQHIRRFAARLRDRLLVPSLHWAGVDPAVRLLHVPELSAAHVPAADAVIATWWSTVECVLGLPPSAGRRFHLVQGLETWGGAPDRIAASWRAPLHKIFIASWLRDHALELGVSPADTSVVLNGVDLDAFQPHTSSDQRGEHVAMLYSAEPYKGGDFGLAVLRDVRNRVPGLVATLFGISPPPPALPDWIRFVRAVPQPVLARDVYSRAAIYFCPSITDGFHLPNLEAMASGCAVVSSAIPGVRDYLQDDCTALLYPPGDAAAAVAALLRVLRDPALHHRIRRAGAERVAGMDWSRSADQLEAVLTGRGEDPTGGGPVSSAV